jgi:outer membrane protein OmpA-like peptidoglycan-associated protein
MRPRSGLFLYLFTTPEETSMLRYKAVSASRIALALVSAAIVTTVSGCASKGYVRKEVAALETRVANTERAVTRVEEETRSAHEIALDAAFQAQVAKGAALGNVRREEVRNTSVNFDFESDDLTPEAEGVLDGVVSDLQSNASYIALVTGYTDATGSDEYNRDLAQRRASSVQRYLGEKLGSDFVRVATIGYGETNPVADNDTREGRKQNRRAEISIAKAVPISEAEITKEEPKGSSEKPVF